MKVRAEVVIAELNRLRGDVDKDMTDPEYFALHHALCTPTCRYLLMTAM